MKVIPLTENESQEMRKRHAEMVEAGRVETKAVDESRRAETVFYTHLKNLGHMYGLAGCRISEDCAYLIGEIDLDPWMEAEPDLNPDIERCADCRRARDACVCGSGFG